jgi:hypothetical protein
MKNIDRTALLKTVWIASAIAAVFTQSGVYCLLPAAVVTFFAFLTED